MAIHTSRNKTIAIHDKQKKGERMEKAQTLRDASVTLGTVCVNP